jgi:hypothetical protein
VRRSPARGGATTWAQVHLLLGSGAGERLRAELCAAYGPGPEFGYDFGDLAHGAVQEFLDLKAIELVLDLVQLDRVAAAIGLHLLRADQAGGALGLELVGQREQVVAVLEFLGAQGLPGGARARWRYRWRSGT